MSTAEPEEDNPEVILGTYKNMVAECQQLSSKVAELTLERDEHKLVLEQLTKLEGERKAFRLIGGVLVERTVADVLPPIQQNYEGIKTLVETLDSNLKKRDLETRQYKAKHGIMTQSEREAMLKGKPKANP